MNVIREIQVEDCLDGSYIRDFVLDGLITRTFIAGLVAAGDLKYFPEFARPFFTVLKPDRWKIKGVEGNNSLRVVFFKQVKGSPESERGIVDILEGIKE